MNSDFSTFGPPLKTSPESIFFNGITKGQSIAIVGAGSFGGWLALTLHKKGFKVKLIDVWGPGNSMASSGGETRLIRAIYGSNSLYCKMTAKAYSLWGEFQKEFDSQVFFPKETLWMSSKEEIGFIDAALPMLDKYGLNYDILDTDDAVERFPQINFEDVAKIVVEKESGFLNARLATMEVVKLYTKLGGDYIQQQAVPGKSVSGKMSKLVLSNGEAVNADLFVFAAGSWMKNLFPQILGKRLTITRQEVHYFGTPAGVSGLSEADLPAWVDWGAKKYYGLPSGANRGFKIAHDMRGIEVDPSTMDRLASEKEVDEARSHLAHRFPLLRNAPLIESRVCQYTNSEDGNFLADFHPELENAFLLTGGSGHGFKHGPVLAEMICEMLMGKAPLEPSWQIE